MILDQMLVNVLAMGEVFVTKGTFDWRLGAHMVSNGLRSKRLCLVFLHSTHHNRTLSAIALRQIHE